MSKISATADHDERDMIQNGRGTEDRLQRAKKCQRKLHCGKEKQKHQSS